MKRHCINIHRVLLPVLLFTLFTPLIQAETEILSRKDKKRFDELMQRGLIAYTADNCPNLNLYDSVFSENLDFMIKALHSQDKNISSRAARELSLYWNIDQIDLKPIVGEPKGFSAEAARNKLRQALVEANQVPPDIQTVSEIKITLEILSSMRDTLTRKIQSRGNLADVQMLTDVLAREVELQALYTQAQKQRNIIDENVSMRNNAAFNDIIEQYNSTARILEKESGKALNALLLASSGKTAGEFTELITATALEDTEQVKSLSKSIFKDIEKWITPSLMDEISYSEKQIDEYEKHTKSILASYSDIMRKSIDQVKSLMIEVEITAVYPDQNTDYKESELKQLAVEQKRLFTRLETIKRLADSTKNEKYKTKLEEEANLLLMNIAIYSGSVNALAGSAARWKQAVKDSMQLLKKAQELQQAILYPEQADLLDFLAPIDDGINACDVILSALDNGLLQLSGECINSLRFMLEKAQESGIEFPNVTMMVQNPECIQNILYQLARHSSNKKLIAELKGVADKTAELAKEIDAPLSRDIDEEIKRKLQIEYEQQARTSRQSTGDNDYKNRSAAVAMIYNDIFNRKTTGYSAGNVSAASKNKTSLISYDSGDLIWTRQVVKAFNKGDLDKFMYLIESGYKAGRLNRLAKRSGANPKVYKDIDTIVPKGITSYWKLRKQGLITGKIKIK